MTSPTHRSLAALFCLLTIFVIFSTSASAATGGHLAAAAAVSTRHVVDTPSVRSTVAADLSGSKDGSTASRLWDVESTPDVEENIGELSGVSCPGADMCVAVGSSTSSTGNVTLAESWNGTSWSIQPTPTPPGSTNSAFAGVSCATSNACMAVGVDNSQTGKNAALAEFWNGASWTVQNPIEPDKGQTSDSFSGVSCASPLDCTAVGFYDTTTGTATLAEGWNGTGWSRETTPNSKNRSQLNGVSCVSSDECVAVGQAGSKTLGELWNGTGWSITKMPKPAQSAPTLSGISCTSLSFCMTVGSYYAIATGQNLALAESWDGAKWSLQNAADPSSDDDYLRAVSCFSPTSCSAAGVDGNASTSNFGDAG